MTSLGTDPFLTVLDATSRNIMQDHAHNKRYDLRYPVYSLVIHGVTKDTVGLNNWLNLVKNGTQGKIDFLYCNRSCDSD
jgi:hypothetical protein